MTITYATAPALPRVDMRAQATRRINTERKDFVMPDKAPDTSRNMRRTRTTASRRTRTIL